MPGRLLAFVNMGSASSVPEKHMLSWDLWNTNDNLARLVKEIGDVPRLFHNPWGRAPESYHQGKMHHDARLQLPSEPRERIDTFLADNLRSGDGVYPGTIGHSYLPKFIADGQPEAACQRFFGSLPDLPYGVDVMHDNPARFWIDYPQYSRLARLWLELSAEAARLRGARIFVEPRQRKEHPDLCNHNTIAWVDHWERTDETQHTDAVFRVRREQIRGSVMLCYWDAKTVNDPDTRKAIVDDLRSGYEVAVSWKAFLPDRGGLSADEWHKLIGAR